MQNAKSVLKYYMVLFSRIILESLTGCRNRVEERNISSVLNNLFFMVYMNICDSINFIMYLEMFTKKTFLLYLYLLLS